MVTRVRAESGVCAGGGCLKYVTIDRPLIIDCELAQPGVSPARPRPLRSAPRAALFVDRDGVVVENRDTYILKRAHAVLLHGVIAALRHVQNLAIPVVIVSNQSPAGRGLISLEQTAEIHRHILRMLAAEDVVPTCSLVCPHCPEDRCWCRKPAPGMLLEAAAVHGIDLRRSCLVGDARTDLTAARRAGVGRAVLVATGHGEREARRLSALERHTVTLAADLAAATSGWIAENKWGH
jgi:D-glycero-D-manno-heptose 1,7-bisphosphate phosphatase